MDDAEKGKEIVDYFTSNGLVLSSNALHRILEDGLNLEDVLAKARENSVWLISDEFLIDYVKDNTEIGEAAQEISGEPTVKVEKSRKVFAKDVESRLTVIEESDVTGKSTCDGTLQNFIEYFNYRYDNLREVLRERPSMRSSIPIEAVRKVEKEVVRIIGMVADKRETRNGNKFLEIEDPTGSLSVFIPRDVDKLHQAYDQVLLDEIIGIEGVYSKELFIAMEITEPDIPISHKQATADEPVCAAFISDLHVGSYLFLEREFQSFVEWLNGKGNKRELADKIKYIVIAGDLVDGIGIYPNQQKELTIPDIYKQYDFLAQLLSEIPDYIEVVVSMGNHDAVRNAEPQPKVSKELAPGLYELDNVHVVGNPVWIKLHGIKTLVYHGTTLDTIIGSLSHCTYTSPENAMIEYLKKRHLAPVYGNDGISPESRDYMLLNEVPDILHCGHVHTNGYANYRGVKVINSGAWQGKTRYQEMLGHQPTPARVPILDLQSMEATVVHFGDDEI